MISTEPSAPAEPARASALANTNSSLVMLAGSLPARHLVNAGFALHARLRTAQVAALDPRQVQLSSLMRLVRRAKETRFGRDHGFNRIQSVADYQKAVPLRTYEALWN